LARPPVFVLSFAVTLSDDQAVLCECLDDPPDVGTECVTVGVAQGARDGLGDGAGVVLTVAIGEHERGSEVEVLGPGAGAVVQGEPAGRGMEAEIGTGSRVAAPARSLLHITKLSLAIKSATSYIAKISTCLPIVWKTGRASRRSGGSRLLPDPSCLRAAELLPPRPCPYLPPLPNPTTSDRRARWPTPP